MWEGGGLTEVKLSVPETPISAESRVMEYVTSSEVMLEPVKLMPAPV